MPDEIGAAQTRPLSDALEGRQAALYRALHTRESTLAVMYVGAILVLRERQNPDRFPQAAHSIRELMEKIPAVLDVATPAQRESLGDRARRLSEEMDRCKSRSQSFDGGQWQGAIDPPVARLLKHADQFHQWFEEHRPRRRDEVAQTLRRLDPAGAPLPSVLEQRNLDSWIDMRDFFVRVAHHGRDCDDDTFTQWLGALEGFLLERLVPRTFDDLAALDSLIAEVEGGA